MWPAVIFLSYFQHHVFVYRFKIGACESWAQVVHQVFPNSQRDWKLGFLNVALAGFLIFSQFMDEIENCDVGILAKTVSPNFS